MTTQPAADSKQVQYMFEIRLQFDSSIAALGPLTTVRYNPKQCAFYAVVKGSNKVYNKVCPSSNSAIT